MSLNTRCPQCATAFRVLPAQLSAKGGRVRCGKCTAVFDGVAHLVAPPEQKSPEPSPQLGLFDPGRAPARTAPPVRRAATRARALAATELAEVEFLAEPPPPQRFALLWGFLAFLAFAGLLAQATYHFRTEIGVLVPELRPHLGAVCAALGCEVRLPRRPELMSIESSELQADAQRDAVIVLNAVLRNRAPFPQEFPALELTLTDAGENTLARRVLAPADYLRAPDADARIAQGIAAGTEVYVRVPLDTRRVSATGYRIYLFYP